jgi:hypothetical protein
MDIPSKRVVDKLPSCVLEKSRSLKRVGRNNNEAHWETIVKFTISIPMVRLFIFFRKKIYKLHIQTKLEKMKKICSSCKKEHKDLKKNGEIGKTCLRCREEDRRRRKMRLIPDENGLAACRRCGIRKLLVNETSYCIECLNFKLKLSEKRTAPFKAQVEEYRKKYPYCAISGRLIEDEDDEFDHMLERGPKVAKVTDYLYWMKNKNGKTLDEKLNLHRLELEKCQRVTSAEHKRLTRERKGELSTHKRAVERQRRRAMVHEENWEFIRRVQKGVCGCVDNCGIILDRENMAIDFDHMWGNKSFNMAHALRYSKEKRQNEREKGRFIIRSHHRKITKRRIRDIHEERMKKLRV